MGRFVRSHLPFARFPFLCLLVIAAGVLVPARAGGASGIDPVPTFVCAAPNGDNTFTYFFGYTLAGPSSVTIPVGPDNQFTGKDKSLGQPTVFDPGNHPDAFSVTTEATRLEWHLSGTHLSAESSQLCTNMPVVSEAPTALVLPFATAVPFVAWFLVMRRRGRTPRQPTV